MCILYLDSLSCLVSRPSGYARQVGQHQHPSSSSGHCDSLKVRSVPVMGHDAVSEGRAVISFTCIRSHSRSLSFISTITRVYSEMSLLCALHIL